MRRASEPTVAVRASGYDRTCSAAPPRDRLSPRRQARHPPSLRRRTPSQRARRLTAQWRAAQHHPSPRPSPSHFQRRQPPRACAAAELHGCSIGAWRAARPTGRLCVGSSRARRVGCCACLRKLHACHSACPQLQRRYSRSSESERTSTGRWPRHRPCPSAQKHRPCSMHFGPQQRAAGCCADVHTHRRPQCSRPLPAQVRRTAVLWAWPASAAHGQAAASVLNTRNAAAILHRIETLHEWKGTCRKCSTARMCRTSAGADEYSSGLQ